MSEPSTGKSPNGTGDLIEMLIEKTLFASRWVLIVFYLGLAVSLGVYAVSFIVKSFKIASSIFVLSDNEIILAMLGLIDACLVASLMVMVMLSGYENFVSRLDKAGNGELDWLGKIDTGSLKVKIASAIVAISSIHLLQVFLNATQYDDSKIMWTTLIHLAFVASALALAIVDRIAYAAKTGKEPSGSPPPAVSSASPTSL